MYLKPCPFCNSEPDFHFDNNEEIYIISCKQCKKEGLIINIKGKDKFKIRDIWNKRNIQKEENNDKSFYGYLIMPDNTIIECIDSHPEELLIYCGIEKNDGEFDCEELCIELGIIRICIHNNCLFVVMPKKYKKSQIDNLLQLIMKDFNQIINSYCIYEYKQEEKVTEFKTLNELILYIDGI